MLGSNLGPLQLVHWQSDALTTQLDLIRLVSNRSGVVPGAAGPGAQSALQHLRRIRSADRPALPLPLQQQYQRGAGGRLPVIRRDPAG
jgi:hypothetical protein